MKRGAEQLISSKGKKIKTEQIQDVPNEIWQVIFSHLPPSFWGMVRQVSMGWHTLVQDLSQQSIVRYFSYLKNHPDYQIQPLRLFMKEYQRYQKNLPNIPIDVILSVLQENTDIVSRSEADPDFQGSLYGLRFARGYPLPEKGLSEQNILQIKRWAMIFAAWQGNIQLLEELSTLQGIGCLHKEIALECAAQNGHVKAIEKLVAHGMNVNTHFFRIRPIQMAAHEGHVKVIAQLAALGADVNAATNDGLTPIHIAARNGHVEAIVKLVELGADVNTAAKDGATPVSIAAEEGHVEAIVKLIELGADVNATIYNGATPVYIAAQEGRVEVIAKLIELGANVNTAAEGGATPIFIAAQEGHAKVVQFLLEQNVHIQPYISSAKLLSNFAQSRGGVVIDRMDQFIQEKIQEGNPVEKIPLLPSEIAYIMGHNEIVNMFKTSSEVVITAEAHLCPHPPAMTFTFNAKKDLSSSSSEEGTMETDKNNRKKSFFSRDCC